MEITWLGTAGFIIKSPEGEIAFDPFLSRGIGTKSPFTVKSFQNTGAIFVGHGHFDHAYDIPEISKNADLKIFAPGLTGQILKLRGVDPKKLIVASNQEKLHHGFKMRAFHSAHVKFDLSLILSTMHRCGIRGCIETCKLGLLYPKGLVQTYLFECQGKKFLYMSSAGAKNDELKKYQSENIDYFLAPLQGHSQIQKIAAKQVAIINPKFVIPHHHDDFYPPLSQNISLETFINECKVLGFKGEVLEIPLFQTITI